jgi:hypothetical protein
LAATRWLRHDGRRSLVVANGKFSILDALATINIGDPATTIPHLDTAALAGKDIDLTGVAFTVANVAADSKYEPSKNFDALISEMLADRGVDYTIAP